MKKWLNDLYAILLKRGYNTLDNSLKNYEKIDKQLSKKVLTGTLEPSGSFEYDLNNYGAEISSIILTKCVFSNGKILIIPIIRLGENNYIRLITFGISPGITATLTNSTLSITNDSQYSLSYSLYLNLI